MAPYLIPYPWSRLTRSRIIVYTYVTTHVIRLLIHYKATTSSSSTTQIKLCLKKLYLLHRMESLHQQQQQHILVVTFPIQSHINPALHLAKWLSRVTGARITFSTSVSAHRRMFPSLSAPDQEVHDGLVTFIPFSDGYDVNGFNSVSAKLFMAQFELLGARNLSTIVDDLATRGHPVTCIVYTILLTWATDVAREHGIPSALYWIQPATVFSIYYHFFHGYQSLIASHGNDPSFVVDLPGLRPLKVGDLPSFLTITDDDHPYRHILTAFQQLFKVLERDDAKRSKSKVLLNTFDELELETLSSIGEMELITTGPSFPFLVRGNNYKTDTGGNLFKHDEKGYMEWLDSKPEEGSVVYVSFGSISMIKKRQMEEILEGLRESGRPYLWVVRKDNRGEGVELGDDGEGGMVVEWCSQIDVLSHPSVGCFVTHCGWNSTLESVACGVPMVCVPQWTEQGTNAWLVTTAWGTGVRGEVNSDGVLPGRELSRCLEMVMGEHERGAEIRRNAKMWSDKAVVAIGEGGSSDRNLKAFVKEMDHK